MKRKIFELMAVLALTVLVFGGCAANKQDAGNVSAAEDSPEWIASLGNEKNAEQLFVVAGVGQTTAYVSMHEKDANGNWKTIMTTPGCIGKSGLGKTKEGDAKTPVGEFRFNYAFGIADDPGCAIKYHKVTDDDYWSGDVREGYEYNKMVSIKDHPDLDTGSSEHIVDYNKHYQHCLNISYNEEGTPGKGSAIFLHCLGPYKPYTGGCVAIPYSDMVTVMKNVKEDCVVVIDSLKVLSPETWEDWGLEAGTDDNIGEYDPASFRVSDVYEAPGQTASIDISGCDTFTQIVDKLDKGKGYANATIGDADVLMVSSGTYEWEKGEYAAIDSDIFIYKDGAPVYLTTVAAGGTAYPLAVKDGNLYVGGNHYMLKYLIDDGFLIEAEEAYVKYDTEGNDTFYYRTCNSQFEDYDEKTAESRFDELFEEQGTAEVISFQPAGGAAVADGSLPAYEYPGPELFYSVLYKYMIDELGKNYSDHQVCIPCPVIIKEDESDKSDIRVYGNFWIFNYNRNGTTMENTSGGSYPGCIHLKTTDEGYEVTSMDIVEDGSGFTDSAKKIFGDNYDLFMKDGEDETLREKTRAQIIANYVAANNLDITAYQDYGWEPVTLPEENIDSFYSILD